MPKARTIFTGKSVKINGLKVADRFWSKVRVGSGCWFWMACTDDDGYGRFSLNGTSVNAQRVAYVLSGRKLPDNRDVHHRCHNRACVNPEHLQKLTRTRNVIEANMRRARETDDDIPF